MTIKEAEEKTGLQRSNIRFYEKEKLVIPKRNDGNGYREYSEEDVYIIKKIAYLRSLGISVDDIRRIMKKEIPLYDVVNIQAGAIESRLGELENAKMLCKSMLQDKNICFEKLEVEKYVPDLDEQWKKSSNIFRLDSVSFFFLWGAALTFCIIAAASLMIAVVSFRYLPQEIPVQWRNGEASSLVDKTFIFAYPAACVVIRFLLRPFIWRWLQMHAFYSDAIADYITNYMCFAAVSAQAFTILFINGSAQNITTVLAVDTFVLLGLLAAGWYQLSKRNA